MAGARTPGKWPYVPGRSSRLRRVIKLASPADAARGVQRREHAPKRPPVSPAQARLLLGLAFFFALAAFGWWLLHGPWLTVRGVEVTGASRLSAQEVRAAAGLDGARTFGLDLESARTRVAALPGVRAVTIGRRGRSTVVIDVQERRPWGAWRIDGADVVIDDEGYVLDGQAAPAGAPTIVEVNAQRAINVGDRLDPGAVEAAVRLTRESDKTLGRKVIALLYRRESGLTVVLSGADAGDPPLWATFGDARDYDYKVAALDVLTAQAREAEVPVGTVDLRFGDRLSFQ